ncbi:MAG: Smr/MutS family protein [Rectinemataceae bacterium]|nr:Smr/MutS family protein [Rectinemataceae bacterium]
MMNEHSLSLLEFGRIRESVSGYCVSDEGRRALLDEGPLSDTEAVRSLKRSVGLVLAGLRELGTPSFSFPPVARPVVMLAKPGVTLELDELYAIGIWARSFGSFTDFLHTCFGLVPVAERMTERAGPVTDLVARAPGLTGAATVVFKILTKDGELKDLPGIREARERIARTHREIGSLADSYFRDPEIRAMLQSGEPTVRDGRTVLALRANFKGRIKGIVHEVSATGQTVFIEPADLVEKNNALVEEEARYNAEVRRALRETTEQLAGHAGALAEALSVMAVLDGIFARARHSKNGGLVLACDRERGFFLKGARHPLIGAKAVPIDVELPENVRTLVITGPNTGGKTVTLKTIGLFALMNQFGLGLPAAPETGFAVFDSVFADIGDEQSIDQSLSTFSGHMKVIGGIVGEASSRSLVLLDELGSGTDPEEGCAMAMSLLDTFIGRDSLTILTTHHGILKNYGYSREHCLNASMDFDRTSLSPTYRILMGVPGESRALDIAVRNGLPEEIVKGAARYLSEERTDVSELIKSLNEKHRKLEDLEAERRRRVRDAMADQRKADLAALRNKRQELELRSRGVGELKRLLSESRKTLENLVREVREGSLTSEKTKAVKQFLSDLADSVGTEVDRLESGRTGLDSETKKISETSYTVSGFGDDAELASGLHGIGFSGSAFRERRGSAVVAEAGDARNASSQTIHDLSAGDPVWVGSGRRPGTILRKAKKGFWQVETDSIRLTVPESELVYRGESKETAPMYHVELAPRGEGGSSAAVFELDLRGMRLAEALTAVERQVDAASLQNLSLFSIIHGTGEGILGKGVQDYLKHNPAVADYHFARPEEGGYGKTIVRLK